MLDDLAGSKYARRSELESWAVRHDARLEYRRDRAGWIVVTTVAQSPETIVLTSDPRPSIEQACVVVLGWLAEASLDSPGTR